jgi:hypothetical protein
VRIANSVWQAPSAIVLVVVLVLVLDFERDVVIWLRKRGQVCGLVFDLLFDFAGGLPRRDNRTQPGVLTPGTGPTTTRPEGAEDILIDALFESVCRI